MFEIITPSFRPKYVEGVRKSLHPHKVRHLDGTDYPSFSKLINDCIVSCEFETVIIVGDKCRPKSKHIVEMCRLLGNGFGFVGLYRFGFFGFTKELIRRVGFFDERFVGGGYDDHDFISRMREADLAIYLAEAVKRVENVPSTWHTDYCLDFFIKKWGTIPGCVGKKRTMPEESYDYDIGPARPEMPILPWCRSLGDHRGQFFINMG